MSGNKNDWAEMKSRLFSRPTVSWLATVAVVAAAYYAAARVGLMLQIPGTNSSPVWPPSGIGFAAVMIWGYRVWPGIALGAFLANLHTLPPTWAGLATSCGICVGNTLEQVIGVYLLRRVIGEKSPFDRAKEVFVFGTVAAICCVIAASNGIGHLWLWQILPPQVSHFAVWFTWWLGDQAGILILTPVILSWWEPAWQGWPLGRKREAATVVPLPDLNSETQHLIVITPNAGVSTADHSRHDLLRTSVGIDSIDHLLEVVAVCDCRSRNGETRLDRDR